MRIVLATLIWLLDLILKFALGYLVVFMIWLPYTAYTGAGFAVGWVVASGILGACINGFFEGCEFILLGLAKRVSGER